jgi:glycine/D-amino acid oxidase-like deaminating enzyme
VSTDVVVAGGGIAGLAAAWALSRREGLRVALFEPEPMLATHSSARNAAIWLPCDDDATTPALALRSAEIMDELIGREAWLTPTGAIVTSASEPPLAEVERGAERTMLATDRIGIDEARRFSPMLAGGAATDAVLVPDAGTLDVHAMTRGLERAAVEGGVAIHLRLGIRRVIQRDGRVSAVELDDGARIATEHVVIAPGAWAAALGETAGAPLPVTPYRRHLAQLDTDPRARGPIVWHAGADETYFRPESGGVLASPCDETPHAPCLPPVEPAQIDDLARRLVAAAPGLANARVRRAWACLRTFAPDRELVIGEDPRVRGLFWLAGFGGRGMTVAPAAGELFADLFSGKKHRFAVLTSPARLLTL